MITRCWELSKQRVINFLSLLLGLIFVYLSLESFWTDSEMWATVVVKYMFQNDPSYAYAIKPLFNFILWANFKWAYFLDLHPMVTGRFLMGLNGLLLAYLVSRILFLLTKDRNAAFLGFILLFAFSTFVKRGGQIRSDLLVSTFIFLGIYYRILKTEKRWLPLLFWFLAMLISPKASLFSIPLIIYLFFENLYSYKKLFLYILVSLFISILLINPLRLALLNSWGFFIESFTEKGMGFGYFDPIRFIHVLRFLKENSILLAFLIGSLFVYYRCKTKQVIPKIVSIVALISFLILIFYPDRLPFLIASLLPFFCLYLVALLFSIWNKKWIYSIVIILSFTSFGYWSQDMVRNHSNEQQRFVADWLDQQLLVLPELSIWDPTGVLARSKAYYFFLGPAQVEDNFSTLHFIKEAKVDIFLYTAKAFYLEPELFPALRLNYYNIGGGVYLKRELDGKVDSVRLNQLKRAIAEGMRDKLLTKLYRFDFEY